ncbi:MAG: hypothetical protein K5765_00570 [Clostridia bacterium]|nr:hypothetical protein [Clostridia bacterium]
MCARICKTRTNKIIFSVLLIAIIFSFVFTLVFTGYSNSTELAKADDPVFDGTPSLRYLEAGGNLNVYSDYKIIGTNVVENVQALYVFIYDYAQNKNYSYIYSSKKLSDSELQTTRESDWKSVSRTGTVISDGNGHDCLKIEDDHTLDQNIDCYYYFKCSYTEIVDGVQTQRNLYYKNVHVMINVNEVNIGFASVTAQISSNGQDVAYKGEWLASGIKFTVITLDMVTRGGSEATPAAFSNNNEKLYYSTESDAQLRENRWRQVTSNVINISGISLSSAVIYFKLTSANGENVQTYSYGNTPGKTEYKVNMDPSEPTFNVSASTKNAGNEDIEYSFTGGWACNNVVIELVNTSNCISTIKYEYANEDGVWRALSENKLTLDRSQLIRFRATSLAGKTVTSDSRRVLIDKLTPSIQVYAKHPNPKAATGTNPEDISLEKTILTDGVVDFGYANEKATISLYNKNSMGVAIANESNVSFQYQERSSVTGQYPNSWTNMSNNRTDESSSEVYYYLVADVRENVSLAKRYKFRLVSAAGLASDEIEVNVVLLKGVFSIEIENVKANSVTADGWASDFVLVTMVMPTDSVLNNGVYSTPTTSYTFYYSATDNSFGLTSATSTPLEFYKEQDGIVYFLYSFRLIASANSAFQIYAENAAGRASANVEKTDQIKIDVIPPTCDMVAYIQPTVTHIQPDDYVYLDVENPGWVNGSIALRLEVKRGVSGVYVRQMEYARNAQGTILVDAETGEYIWQESSANLQSSETINKESNEYYVYYVYITKEDTDVAMESKEYRFRIYTGSGIYVDKNFVANIDTSDNIVLNKASFDSDGKQIEVNNTGVSSIYDLSDEDNKYYICKTTTATFTSSLDTAEFGQHFNLYYSIFDGTDISNLSAYVETLDYTLSQNKEIEFSVPSNSKGIIYFAVYLVSGAKDYEGNSNKSGKYIFMVTYNTLDLTISYSLRATNGSGIDLTSQMENNEWVAGTIDVDVEIQINNDGSTKVDENYKFYYLLRDNNSTQTLAQLMQNESNWILADGNIIGDRYSFTLAFTNRSFNGKIAISVCNEAGYRNKQEAESAKNIMIDNTLPSIDLAISYGEVTTGHIEGSRPTTSDNCISNQTIEVGGNPYLLEKWTYYSSTEIYYSIVSNNEASEITYYYQYLGSSVSDITNNVVTLNTETEKHLLQLTATNNTLEIFKYALAQQSVDFNPSTPNKYYTVYFAMYAVNSVGGEDESAYLSNAVDKTVTIERIYEFVFDSSTLSGEMSSSASYISSKGMEGFLDQNYIYLNVNTVSGIGAGGSVLPKEYIKYQFSVDAFNKKYNNIFWFDYVDGVDVKWAENDAYETLIFSAEQLEEYVLTINEEVIHPFENGVSSPFIFRAINKAGTYYEFDKLYILIDETVPEFTINAKTSKGANYTGGDVGSINNIDAADWTNGPVTIEIKESVIPVCGVSMMYKLQYLDNGTTTETEEMKVPGLIFTTDMISGFNRNRDAVLTIILYNANNHEKKSEVQIRISVDQVVPVFSMEGKASNDESDTEVDFVNGGWTSKSQVSISKSIVNSNVSPVIYTYIYEDATRKDEEKTWGEEQGTILVEQSCVLTVIARSGAGLEYSIRFVVNIDTVAPVIKWDTINVIDGENYYIDLRVYVEEANIEICEYITIKGDERGFAFDPSGYILSTSSVDNSIRYDASGNEYRGYVKIYVKDYAGNTAFYTVNILPFNLTVSNITLSDEDLAQVDLYEDMLSQASGYITSSRKAYFENLISRLRDRINTLRNEISTYQDYLEKIANRSSFELKSDYKEMFSYMETYNDYAKYGTEWIQKAITGDSTSKYYRYYQNFKTQFDRLDKLMKAVEKVQDDAIALPAINMVEREDYEEILKVYNEYFNLTLDQRTCFESNLYNKIIDLKSACEALLLTDKTSGVKIDGDVAEGATISVDTLSNTSDTYKNAQELLVKNNDTETEPSYIVSIHRISLDGAYSQTTTGELTVTLPIPEDYRGYIYFSVYTLSDDGAMRKVEDSQITKDGESVVFKTESLSTYVLCTRADIKKTETTAGEYGTVLGLPLTTKMIRYLIYGGIALFGIVILVVVIMGIRHRRFLNSYNKAYRHSLYRKGVKGIPKGNKK